MKLWVVGAGPGSLGETIASLAQLRVYDIISGTSKEFLDVRNWGAIEDFLSDRGPFDHIVYSAGIAHLEWIRDLSRAKVEDLFDVNLFGFLGVMRGLSRRQESGSIVVITSDSSRVAMRGSISYCASKAALEQAVRVAARELAPLWTVNALSPSAMDGTNMTARMDRDVPKFRGWSPEEAYNYELGQVPIGRRATKEEVAEVALDLLQAPAFLTGSIIYMTGGK